LELTQEQKDRILPLLKVELANKAREYTSYLVTRNRYQDLLDTIDEKDREYEKERVSRYKLKIDDYNQILDMFTKEITLLESIETELTKN